MTVARRFSWTCAALLSVLACWAPLAAAPPVDALLQPAAPPAATDRAAAESLADYLRHGSGRYAYGLYIGTQKIGWTIDDTRLGELDGRPVAVIVSEGRMEMLMMGNKSTFVWNQKAIHELSGEGVVLRIDETSRDDDRTTTILAQRHDNTLHIRTEVAGHAAERTTPLPKSTLRRMQQLDHWLEQASRVGEEFQSYNTALDSQDIDRLEVYQYRGRRPAHLGGVATESIHVQMKTDGALYEMDVLPNGKVVKGKLGPFDMRLEEEAVARNLQAPVIDMAFEVPVDAALGDPRRVDSLSLELRELGDFHVPQSSTQRVRQRPDGTTLVDITRTPAASDPQPLSDADRATHTAATPSVQSDEPKIRDLAAEIIGQAANPRAKAERINRWVHEHLKQTYQANATTALEVLDRRAGDCTEHTLLFVSLCRAAGVPAREVGGLAYDESQVVRAAEPRTRGTFNWHAWGEIHDGRHWISMDPTWNEVEVDATHLVLSVGPEDFAWLNVLGKMKIRVAQFSRSAQ